MRDESPKESKIKHDPESRNYVLSRVQLHQAFTISGMTETSLYRHKGIDMLWTPDGVLVECKGIKAIIPLANVIVAYLL